jgi:hypothetical protein
MRVNAGGGFRPDGSARFVPLRQMVPKVGMSFSGQGTAFSTPSRQMAGTLLGWWGPGYKEPWLILSDLAPEQGDACWYGLRSWIEQGFKDSKRGGWQWQHTRMEDPQRILWPPPHRRPLRVAVPCGRTTGLPRWAVVARLGKVAAIRRWFDICARGATSPWT